MNHDLKLFFRNPLSPINLDPSDEMQLTLRGNHASSAGQLLRIGVKMAAYDGCRMDIGLEVIR